MTQLPSSIRSFEQRWKIRHMCSNSGCGYFCSLEDLPSYERVVQLEVASTFTRQDGDVNQNKYQDVKCIFKAKVYYLRYQLQLTSLMSILASISYGYLYIASRFSISCSKFNYLVTAVHYFCYKNCAKFPKMLQWRCSLTV